MAQDERPKDWLAARIERWPPEPRQPRKQRVAAESFEIVAQTLVVRLTVEQALDLTPQPLCVHCPRTGYWPVISDAPTSSIKQMFCTAAPAAPLPRLSSRATRTAWRRPSLPKTLSSRVSVPLSASGSMRALRSEASAARTTRTNFAPA